MIGKTISHYKILEKLGQGGMGVVYKAEDIKLGRTVALKFLPPSFSYDEEAKTRFIHEAQSASALDHNNICNIHEINETEDGQLFISMAFYKGETLKDKIVKGPVRVDEAIDITLQICEGLEAAHKNDIIHRDIKPANIFITNDGVVKILDFGLAKSKGQTQLTRMESTLGTVDYMSPEQANGTVVDKRTDIWSVGIVLYEMITGQRPFAAEYEQAVIYSILNKEFQTIPGIDEKLQHIINKALAKNPNDRYQNIEEIAEALKKIKGIQSIKGAIRKLKLPWIIAAAVIVALIAVAIFLFRPASKTVKETEAIKTIAVLPFVNMSSDPNQEYFSDGISEELINTLSRNPKLRVTARTSSFYFKGTKTNIKTIAQELNVNHILEGSVRKSGNNLRITADLVNAETNATLWSNSYDGTMSNIFALQDSISNSVAKALNATLLTKEKIVSEQKTDPKVYNLCLLGDHLSDMGGKENLEKAIDYYKQALLIDSNYVSAWLGLAVTHFRMAQDYLSPKEIYPKIQHEFNKVFELDSNYVRAYAIMGLIKYSYDFDWTGAESALKHAMELEPENVNALSLAAGLAFTFGRYDEAIKLQKHIIELNPLFGYSRLGFGTFYAGLLNESIIAFRKNIEIQPSNGGAHTWLGLVYLMKGKLDSALTEMKLNDDTDPNFRNYGLALVYYTLGKKKEANDALESLIREGQNISAYQIAEVYAFSGESDKAFEWLERAYNQHDPGLTMLKGDPILFNIIKDPRYAAFMKKMKLPL